MDNRSIRVELSRIQADYIRGLEPSGDTMKRAIESFRNSNQDRVLIEVVPEVAEELRSVFTERLAQVGFGNRYQLTNEGRILEELIDLFFVDHEV